MPKIQLSVLPGTFVVHRLPAQDPIPQVVLELDFFSITRTDEELSILMPESIPIQSEQRELGWKCLKVLGPLDFGLTGVLAGITGILAEAGISIFTISTYDTDYILIKEDVSLPAVEALSRADYSIV